MSVKYFILKKEQSLRGYREGYTCFSYCNITEDVKVRVDESLLRYILCFTHNNQCFNCVCDRFEIKED